MPLRNGGGPSLALRAEPTTRLPPQWLWAQRFVLLLLITFFSLAANGYHYGADDAGLYIPAILQRLHPQLFPFDASFIGAQADYSLYATVASGLALCLGGSIAKSIFVLHFLGLLVLLTSGWKLADAMFNSHQAAWCAVLVLACSTSIYVAGTSIPIMDPYFTARTLSTPCAMLTLSSVATRRWGLALSAFCGACAFHPLMALQVACFGACYRVVGRVHVRNRLQLLNGVFLPLSWGATNNATKQALEMPSRIFLFASRWSAVDWAGVVVPVSLFVILWRIPFRAASPLFARMCASAALCGGMATIFFLIFSLVPGLEGCVRFQPMRSFQLLYMVMFLLVGGLVGEFLMRTHAWRWAVLFAALGMVDFAIDHAAYPSSPHIEWPNAPSSSPWLEAFNWARLHTREDALFALPPDYINAAGEDRHGFRALAERSTLMDEVKDSGIASMLPAFAPEWKRQIDAQSGWTSFTRADFQRLARQYPVSWVIVQIKQASGLNCPYENEVVAVCRIAP